MHVVERELYIFSVCIAKLKIALIIFLRINSIENYMRVSWVSVIFFVTDVFLWVGYAGPIVVVSRAPRGESLSYLEILRIDAHTAIRIPGIKIVQGPRIKKHALSCGWTFMAVDYLIYNLNSCPRLGDDGRAWSSRVAEIEEARAFYSILIYRYIDTFSKHPRSNKSSCANIYVFQWTWVCDVCGW